MASDARGHTTPAATDHPSRNTLLNLSLSIRDPSVVANTTARATLVSAMTTAGQTPSTSNPLFLYRTDSGTYEMTVDGTNFFTIPLTPAPQAYTPSWTATTTNPTIGNGTLVGQWWRAGNLMIVNVNLTIGSTTNIGSGVYSFSLPIAAATGFAMISSCYFVDTSLSNNYPGSCQIASGGSTIARSYFSSPGSAWSSSVPVAPASGDLYQATALLFVP